MNELSKPAVDVVSPLETVTGQSRPRIFVSESPQDYEALRAAYFAELKPATAYETSLAENLVRYEWEMTRLRRFRDTAVLAQFRDLALKTLVTGDPNGYLPSGTATEDDHLLVRDLVSLDHDERRMAEEDFRKRCTWEPADLFGLAYARATAVTKLEERIADIERRRRLLRADYAALKAVSAYRTVGDAEVVEGAA